MIIYIKDIVASWKNLYHKDEEIVTEQEDEDNNEDDVDVEDDGDMDDD